ncbi:hypothetical protein D3C84_930840 [compost metagenome]
MTAVHLHKVPTHLFQDLDFLFEIEDGVAGIGLRLGDVFIITVLTSPVNVATVL